MKCKQKCKGKAEDDPRTEKHGAGRPKAGRPPQHFFSAVLILCLGSPWHVCLHFIRRSMVNHHYFSNANGFCHAFLHQIWPYSKAVVFLKYVHQPHPLFSFWLGVWVLCLIVWQGYPWDFCLHFIRRSMVNHHYCSNANGFCHAFLHQKWPYGKAVVSLTYFNHPCQAVSQPAS